MVIDCIEFNDRFRCGDVAGDVAFLAMELEAARRPDLAAGFLARFAEASDDFGLYGVLDFYLSYRAWVRGKVAAFVAADPERGRGRARAQAGGGAPATSRSRDRSRAARSIAPFVIAVGGVIGSGKSTLAAALGRELAVPVVSSDRTRKAIAGLAATARGGADLYTDAAVERTYGEVLRRAGAVLFVRTRRGPGRDLLGAGAGGRRRRRRPMRSGRASSTSRPAATMRPSSGPACISGARSRRSRMPPTRSSRCSPAATRRSDRASRGSA